MSAQAPALRIPGKSSSHRPARYALAVFVLVAALTTALVFVTTNSPAPTPAVVHPATHAQVAPVSGEGVRVGGTSIYRFHPLPVTNYALPQTAVLPVSGEGVRVGGTSIYRYHPYPSTNYAAPDLPTKPASSDLIVGGTGAERFHLLP